MEAPALTEKSNPYFFGIVSVVISVVVAVIVYILFSKMNTVPSGLKKEGFQGPARGVSSIPCGQESSEVTAILEIFEKKRSSTEEGKPDLEEFKQILSKLCCMKHDLMGVSQSVQNMMYLQYNNTHDRENPADTVARCFTKSIPPRDLGITFATWKDRALVLLNRLCTSYNLSSSNSEKVIKHFTSLWMDVFSIAKKSCSPPADDGSKVVSPRDVKGFTPETVEELGAYTGYY